MSLTKADYVKRGWARALLDALDGALATSETCKPSLGTWQRTAYDEGYSSVKVKPPSHEIRRQGTAKAQEIGEGIKLAQMPANTLGWPAGAAEHARRLAEDINQGKGGPSRVKRLYRALGRMQKRHEAAARGLRDFPMSTQPHPDGPVTVGMLLRESA